VIDRIAIRRGTYRDSVALMVASQEAAALPGVDQATAVSATPINLELLRRNGFDLGEEELGPNDLVVAIRAESEETAEGAEQVLDRRLSSVEAPSAAAEAPPRSIRTAARRNPASNLAMVSVPGPNAAYECALAIESGLHAFCFSSGFPARIEEALKREAIGRGLLMMGPDCGTAVLDGVGVGFANELERGPVGMIGASGTGMQQIACLLDAAGIGISQAVGVGGRDLSADVGGSMTLHALSLLAEDADTEVVVVVGKTPHPEVAAEVARAAGEAGKPVVLCFPGVPDSVAAPGPAAAGIDTAATLEQGAAAAAERLGSRVPLEEVGIEHRGGLIRGLFSGGTLRDEAAAVIAAAAERSDGAPPLSLDREPDGPERARHLLIDFGSEELTQGRLHPMIDPSLRNEALERESRDPDISVVLVDVVLGRTAHPDPAAELAPAVERALDHRGSALAVIVSLCGAKRDPQGLELQRKRLQGAGAIVIGSNRRAALLAAGAALPDVTATSGRT
jgi:FdrA protein